MKLKDKMKFGCHRFQCKQDHSVIQDIDSGGIISKENFLHISNLKNLDQNIKNQNIYMPEKQERLRYELLQQKKESLK